MNEADYKRIEREIASDQSPVGIDAKKTHVMILAKLEGIESRLEALERTAQPAQDGAALSEPIGALASNGLAAAVDTFDDTVSRLRDRGVDVDERARAALHVIDRMTEPGALGALGRILERLEALEPMTQVASQGRHAVATAVDALDEEFARAAERGIEVDVALRNGLAAILFLGQRVSTTELNALGELLRSEVLHPSAVDVVGRLGRALVAAAEKPVGSGGPIGAFSRLADQDAKRSTAFLLEFARQFGAAIGAKERTTPIDGGKAHG